jgi:hypothetical protein
MPINYPSLAPNEYTELVVQFLADLMNVTIDLQDQAAFQQALQTYCDSLCPWLDPSDGPPNPRTIFSPLENCAFDQSGEHVTVVLSPEAEALFRAWLCRHQIGTTAGLHTAHTWDN